MQHMYIHAHTHTHTQHVHGYILTNFAPKIHAEQYCKPHLYFRCMLLYILCLRFCFGVTVFSGGTTRIVTVTNACEKYSRIIIAQYKHTTELSVYITFITEMLIIFDSLSPFRDAFRSPINFT